MSTRVILDTDIGTDVDDCLAIAFMLGAGGFTFEGITTVYGDVELRARMVRQLLELRGLEGVPIRLGARKPLLGLRDIYWEGHEGEGLLENASTEPFSEEHAVDFIIRTVMENPGEIHRAVFRGARGRFHHPHGDGKSGRDPPARDRAAH
jgi:purine nucleosidase